jgi:hypothetical protein
VIKDSSISSDVGIAVGKDNPALRDALNGAIKAIRADGTYAAKPRPNWARRILSPRASSFWPTWTPCSAWD